MTHLTFLSFAMIVNPRACERVIGVIWDNVKELALFHVFFLGLTTGLNFLIERKIERRMASGEFLIILAINFTVLLLGNIYCAYEFYHNCDRP